MCERTVESAWQDKKPSNDFLSGPYLDPTLKNDIAKGAKGGRRIKCEQPHVWPPSLAAENSRYCYQGITEQVLESMRIRREGTGSGGIIARREKNLRAITKLVDFYDNEVFSSYHELGNIEFAGVPTPLAITHLFAVDPNVERAIYALESQSALELVLLVSRDVEPPLVHPGLVPVERHIGGVHGKRVYNIGIMGTTVARELPHPGYLDVAP